MKPAKASYAEWVERRGRPGRELDGGKDEPGSEMDTSLPETSSSAGVGESQSEGEVHEPRASHHARRLIAVVQVR